MGDALGADARPGRVDYGVGRRQRRARRALGRDQGARTQISDENPFVRFGKEAWAEFWNREAFIRRESRVPAPDHETDLFAGLDGREPGPYGWADEVPVGATGAP